MKTIRIGTRGSKLALWQAGWVRQALIDLHPGLNIETIVITTQGDKILNVPLSQVGGKGLFVKEIEEALLDHRIDLAVHSMKDMPSEIPPGLGIAAVPRREDPRDVLISQNRVPLAQLPHGARIGTSSLRRTAQLRRLRPDFAILPLRGNLDTRLRKLAAGDFDAVVLAAAGVHRLDLGKEIAEYLSPEIMLPAVGQGALAIETRSADEGANTIVAPLNDPVTHGVVLGERAFLWRLEGGCQVPIAAHGALRDRGFTLTGLVADPSGKILLKDSGHGDLASSAEVGLRLAEKLLSLGAEAILKTVEI